MATMLRLVLLAAAQRTSTAPSMAPLRPLQPALPLLQYRVSPCGWCSDAERAAIGAALAAPSPAPSVRCRLQAAPVLCAGLCAASPAGARYRPAGGACKDAAGLLAAATAATLRVCPSTCAALASECGVAAGGACGALFGAAAAMVNATAGGRCAGEPLVDRAVYPLRYGVKLAAAPAAGEVVRVKLDGGPLLLVAPRELAFSGANWSAGGTLRVVRNLSAAWGGAASASFSAGVVASGGGTANASVSAAFTLRAAAGAAGLELSRHAAFVPAAGNRSAAYGLRLLAAPGAGVSVVVDAAAIAGGAVTLTPVRLTFVAANWNVAQDFVAKLGAGSTSAAFRLDASSGITTRDCYRVGSAGRIAVAPSVVASFSRAHVSERGAATDLKVQLATRPLGNVTVHLDGGSQLMVWGDANVSRHALLFGRDTWNLTQTVRVVANDDSVDEGGAHSASLAWAVDALDDSYHGLVGQVGPLTIADYDHAQVTILADSAVWNGSLFVEEGTGTTLAYKIRLSTRPTADVTVSLDTGDQLTASHAQQVKCGGNAARCKIVIAPAKWAELYTVTVFGLDDKVVEGFHHGELRHTVESADAQYSSLSRTAAEGPNCVAPNAISLFAKVKDNDVASVAIGQAQLVVKEGMASKAYTVVLKTIPLANLTVHAVFDRAQLSVAPENLTFGTLNWDAPQTFAVTAVDDPRDETADGSFMKSTIRHSTKSTDSLWQGLAVDSVEVMITDNDYTGIQVVCMSAVSGKWVTCTPEGPTATPVVREGGMTAAYAIRLTSEPNGTMYVNLTADGTEIALGSGMASFVALTKQDWASPHLVHVRALYDTVKESVSNDPCHDGSVAHMVHSPSDWKYAAKTVPNCAVKVVDNEEVVGSPPVVSDTSYLRSRIATANFPQSPSFAFWPTPSKKYVVYAGVPSRLVVQARDSCNFYRLDSNDRFTIEQSDKFVASSVLAPTTRGGEYTANVTAAGAVNQANTVPKMEIKVKFSVQGVSNILGDRAPMSTTHSGHVSLDVMPGPTDSRMSYAIDDIKDDLDGLGVVNTDSGGVFSIVSYDRFGSRRFAGDDSSSFRIEFYTCPQLNSTCTATSRFVLTASDKLKSGRTNVFYRSSFPGKYLIAISLLPGFPMSDSNAVGLPGMLIGRPAGQLEGGSPYAITIVPGLAKASESYTRGNGTISAVAGDLMSFDIVIADKYGNRIAPLNSMPVTFAASLSLVALSTPAGLGLAEKADVAATVAASVNPQSHAYVCSYQVFGAGEYTLRVVVVTGSGAKKTETAIKGSSFTLVVHASKPHPPAFVVDWSGTAPTKLEVDKKLTFKVQAADRFRNIVRKLCAKNTHGSTSCLTAAATVRIRSADRGRQMVAWSHGLQFLPNVSRVAAVTVANPSPGGSDSGYSHVTFTPTVSGLCRIDVSVGGAAIKSSPVVLNVVAGKIDKSKTQIEGPGLYGGVAGTRTRFYVRLRDRHGNTAAARDLSLRGEMQFAGLSTLEDFTVADCLSKTAAAEKWTTVCGLYVYSFVPARVGTLTIRISQDGSTKWNKGAPIVKKTDLRASALMCILTGMRQLTAGENMSVAVQARDFRGMDVTVGGNLFVAFLTRDTFNKYGNIVKVKAQFPCLDNGDGTYNVSLYTEFAVKLELHVIMRDSYGVRPDTTLSKTVQSLYALPARTSATHSRLRNHPKSMYRGLAKHLAGVPLAFVVQAFDRFGNAQVYDFYGTPDNFTISGASGDTRAIVTSANNLRNGSYSLRAVATRTGDYDLSVNLDGVHAAASTPSLDDTVVPPNATGSPFSITVVPGVTSGSHSTVAGSGLAGGSIDAIATFTIQAKDAYGNRQTSGDTFYVGIRCPEITCGALESLARSRLLGTAVGATKEETVLPSDLQKWEGFTNGVRDMYFKDLKYQGRPWSTIFDVHTLSFDTKFGSRVVLRDENVQRMWLYDPTMIKWVELPLAGSAVITLPEVHDISGIRLLVNSTLSPSGLGARLREGKLTTVHTHVNDPRPAKVGQLPFVEKVTTGKYRATYQSSVSGIFQLRVMHVPSATVVGGKAMRVVINPGSFNIAKTSAGIKLTASSAIEALQGAVAGRAKALTLVARDQFDNRQTSGGQVFAAWLRGPKDGAVFKSYAMGQFVDNGDGSYEFTFKPTRAGVYEVNLMRFGKQILDAKVSPVVNVASNTIYPASCTINKCATPGSCAVIETIATENFTAAVLLSRAVVAATSGGGGASDPKYAKIDYPGKALITPRDRYGNPATLFEECSNGVACAFAATLRPTLVHANSSRSNLSSLPLASYKLCSASAGQPANSHCVWAFSPVAGDYLLHVSLMDGSRPVPVRFSPFKLRVRAAACDGARSRLTGHCTCPFSNATCFCGHLRAGKGFKLQVRVLDRFDNPCDPTALALDGNDDFKDGVKLAQVNRISKESMDRDNWQLDATSGGVYHLAVSAVTKKSPPAGFSMSIRVESFVFGPMLLKVSPGTFSARATRYTNGRKLSDIALRTRAGLKNSAIELVTKDQYGNSLEGGGLLVCVEATLAGALAGKTLVTNTIDRRDGSYTITYQTNVSGAYDLRVYLYNVSRHVVAQGTNSSHCTLPTFAAGTVPRKHAAIDSKPIKLRVQPNSADLYASQAFEVGLRGGFSSSGTSSKASFLIELRDSYGNLRGHEVNDTLAVALEQVPKEQQMPAFPPQCWSKVETKCSNLAAYLTARDNRTTTCRCHLVREAPIENSFILNEYPLGRQASFTSKDDAGDPLYITRSGLSAFCNCTMTPKNVSIAYSPGDKNAWCCKYKSKASTGCGSSEGKGACELSNDKSRESCCPGDLNVQQPKVLRSWQGSIMETLFQFSTRPSIKTKTIRSIRHSSIVVIAAATVRESRFKAFYKKYHSDEETAATDSRFESEANWELKGVTLKKPFDCAAHKERCKYESVPQQIPMSSNLSLVLDRPSVLDGQYRVQYSVDKPTQYHVHVAIRRIDGSAKGADTTYLDPVPEVQVIRINATRAQTAAPFRLGYMAAFTGPIPVNATALQMQAAISKLPTVLSSLSVTAGAVGGALAWTVRFLNQNPLSRAMNAGQRDSFVCARDDCTVQKSTAGTAILQYLPESQCQAFGKQRLCSPVWKQRPATIFLPSPLYSEALVSDIFAHAFEPVSFKVQLRNQDGYDIPVGGHTAARPKQSPGTYGVLRLASSGPADAGALNLAPIDLRDGSYSITFRSRKPGEYNIFIRLNDTTRTAPCDREKMCSARGGYCDATKDWAFYKQDCVPTSGNPCGPDRLNPNRNENCADTTQCKAACRNRCPFLATKAHPDDCGSKKACVTCTPAKPSGCCCTVRAKYKEVLSAAPWKLMKQSVCPEIIGLTSFQCLTSCAKSSFSAIILPGATSVVDGKYSSFVTLAHIANASQAARDPKAWLRVGRCTKSGTDCKVLDLISTSAESLGKGANANRAALVVAPGDMVTFNIVAVDEYGNSQIGGKDRFDYQVYSDRSIFLSSTGKLTSTTVPRFADDMTNCTMRCGKTPKRICCRGDGKHTFKVQLNSSGTYSVNVQRCPFVLGATMCPSGSSSMELTDPNYGLQPPTAKDRFASFKLKVAAPIEWSTNESFVCPGPSRECTCRYPRDEKRCPGSVGATDDFCRPCSRADVKGSDVRLSLPSRVRAFANGGLVELHPRDLFGNYLGRDPGVFNSGLSLFFSPYPARPECTLSSDACKNCDDVANVKVCSACELKCRKVKHKDNIGREIDTCSWMKRPGERLKNCVLDVRGVQSAEAFSAIEGTLKMRYTVWDIGFYNVTVTLNNQPFGTNAFSVLVSAGPADHSQSLPFDGSAGLGNGYAAAKDRLMVIWARDKYGNNVSSASAAENNFNITVGHSPFSQNLGFAVKAVKYYLDIFGPTFQPRHNGAVYSARLIQASPPFFHYVYTADPVGRYQYSIRLGDNLLDRGGLEKFELLPIPAPKLVKAQFVDSCGVIIVSFDQPTNKARKLVMSSCADVLAAAIVVTLGMGAQCYWYDFSTLVVSLGNLPTIEPGNHIQLKADTILAFHENTLTGANSVVVQAPRNPPTPQAVLAAPLNTGVCDELILDASGSTGSTGRAVAYRWSVTAGVNGNVGGVYRIAKAGASSTLTIGPTDLVPGEKYTFTVQVTNFWGKSDSATVVVEKSKLAIPKIAVNGKLTRTVLSSEDVFLSGDGQLSSCLSGVPNMKFDWQVLPGSPAIDMPALSKSRDLMLRSGKLTAGKSYQLQFRGAMVSDALLFGTSIVTLVVAYPEIQVRIRGGTRQVAETSKFTVQAVVRDPQDANMATKHSASFTWTCALASNASLPCSGDAFTSLLATTSDRIEIPGKLLTPGQYKFTASAVKDPGSRKASGVAVVTVGEFPVIDVSTANLNEKPGKFGPGDKLILRRILGVDDASGTSCMWSVDNELLNLKDSTVRASELDSDLLIVRPDKLLGGQKYTFTVSCSRGKTWWFLNGVNVRVELKGSASYEVDVNSPPSSGTVLFDGKLAADVVSLRPLTPIQLSAVGWADDASDEPFAYEFAYLRKSTDKREIVLGKSMANVMTVLLPSGQDADSNKVSVIAYIYDKWGARARYPSDVVVTSMGVTDDNAESKAASAARSRWTSGRW